MLLYILAEVHGTIVSPWFQNHPLVPHRNRRTHVTPFPRPGQGRSALGGEPRPRRTIQRWCQRRRWPQHSRTVGCIAPAHLWGVHPPQTWGAKTGAIDESSSEDDRHVMRGRRPWNTMKWIEKNEHHCIKYGDRIQFLVFNVLHSIARASSPGFNWIHLISVSNHT